VRCNGLDHPQLARLLPKEALAKLREEVEMAKGLCPPFDLDAYRAGHLTPAFLGSALNNFGMRELLAGVGELAPVPRPQPAEPRAIAPEEPQVAGFVFKVQANIDPQHRRPHRLCTDGVGPLSVRHEIEEHPYRPPHVGAGPGAFPGARAPRRGGLAR
jgi:peptide subunit release factor RF-3